MGMQFSPMYQPVSTKTIKADGDLDVSPYDVIAYDGNFDTVEADEFVGGVGNFTSGVISGDMQVDGNLKLGVVNVTPSGTWFSNRVSNLSSVCPVYTTVLPLSPLYTYTGSIIFKTPINSTAVSARLIIINNDYTVSTVNANVNQSNTTATLSNARAVYYHCAETAAGNIFQTPILS